MPNLNVAVIGPEGYAKDLGKKGTISDITFYNLKKDDITVTIIEPTRYPEKLSSLFFSVSMSGLALVVVDEINAVFGESVLMLDCAGLKKGVIVLRNYISPDQIAPLIKGTVLESYEIFEDDKGKIREYLLDEAAKVKEEMPAQGKAVSGAIPVDHFFHVKGIGVVVLGGVSSGIVKRHDKLHVLPTKKVAEVRSIQKHDDEAEIAFTGDRVGLALKGVEVEDLDRGYVLTTDESITSSATITGKAELVKYWPTPLKENTVLYIGHWLQFLPCRVAFVDNSGDWKKPKITLKLEKELVYPPGAKALLHYLEGGKLRVTGTVRIE